MSECYLKIYREKDRPFYYLAFCNSKSEVNLNFSRVEEKDNHCIVFDGFDTLIAVEHELSDAENKAYEYLLNKGKIRSLERKLRLEDKVKPENSIEV